MRFEQQSPGGLEEINNDPTSHGSLRKCDYLNYEKTETISSDKDALNVSDVCQERLFPREGIREIGSCANPQSRLD